MKPISKLMGLLVMAILVSMVGIESAMASDPPYWLNGTVTATAGGSGLQGAIVVNLSNATQYATTNANGLFNISGYYNNTNNSIVVNASGYTQQTIISISIQGADNNTYGTSSRVAMVPVTPTISSAASSSVTKNSATVSWTVTATDNVNNNNVANQAIWQAPGVENTTASWSNTTTSPSFSLVNLRSGKAYTVYATTYNGVNNSLLYYAATTVSLTTSLAGVSSYYNPATGGYDYPNQQVVQAPTPVPTVAKKSFLGLGSVTGGSGTKSSTKTKQIIFVFMLVVVGLMIYYAKKGGSKGKKGKR